MSKKRRNSDRGRLRFLRKVLAVQTTYLEHYHEGIIKKWLWKTYIENTYFIEYRTFLDYLDINAKKEIKELEKKISQHEKEQP